MARKRYSDEDVLKLLREIDVHLHDGLDVVSACRNVLTNAVTSLWFCSTLRSYCNRYKDWLCSSRGE